MVQIITTGGTIEGIEYSTDSPEQMSQVSIASLLESTKFSGQYVITKVFEKDSRFITDTDRSLIATVIRESDHPKVLVTHGTLTMVETAIYLGGLQLDKTIVLTGSFVLGYKKDTDAVFNLDYAIEKLQELDQGVFIAMNNYIFTWDNVKKNNISNRFEKLI